MQWSNGGTNGHDAGSHIDPAAVWMLPHTGSENGEETRNSATTAADYKKRFFERDEMKKVP